MFSITTVVFVSGESGDIRFLGAIGHSVNFPTNLTNREREIIPFLLSGATRAEIGEALAISAETVKAHTRNLFAKFDAVNLRDCYKLLSLYQQYFGIGGMDVKMHIKKGVLDFHLLEDRQSLYLERSMTFVVIQGPLYKIDRAYFDELNEITTTFECDAEFELLYARDGNDHRYTVQFNTPVSVGDTLTLIEKTSVQNYFEKTWGRDRINMSSPFSERVMRYHFPKDDIPQTVTCIPMVGASPIELKNVTTTMSGNVFTVEMNNFEMPFHIEVTWRYET